MGIFSSSDDDAHFEGLYYACNVFYSVNINYSEKDLNLRCLYWE